MRKHIILLSISLFVILSCRAKQQQNDIDNLNNSSVKDTTLNNESDGNCSVQVITDMDDTFKIGHSSSTITALYHGLFDKRLYAGFEELFQGFSRCNKGFNKPNIAIVSASPKQLHSKIERMLHQNEMPPIELVLSDWTSDHDTYEFKLASVMQIVKRHNFPVLFLGDDTQFDSKVYDKVKSSLGNRVIGIYIHQITGEQSLPQDAEPFFTSFEVALKALDNKILFKEYVLKVGKQILETEDSYEIIPDFALCPQEPINCQPFQGDIQIYGTCDKVNDRISQICPQ